MGIPPKTGPTQKVRAAKKQLGYKYLNFLVVSPEFQTTHLSCYSNPSNFWVTMPNYFTVNLTSHAWLLQPAFTMVVLPLKVIWFEMTVK